jgi:predicted RNA-binding protein with PUA domain
MSASEYVSTCEYSETYIISAEACVTRVSTRVQGTGRATGSQKQMQNTEIKGKYIHEETFVMKTQRN